MPAIVAGLMLITAPLARAAVDADKSINDKIFQLLMSDKSLAKGTEKTRVTIHDGEVTLVGNVATETDKERLHKAIAGVPGVQQVNDKQLIPKPRASSRFGDGLPN